MTGIASERQSIASVIEFFKGKEIQIVLFKEIFPDNMNYSLITESKKTETNLIRNSAGNLVVNLLPEHPYQYPFHQQIKESLTAEVLSNIKNKYQISEIEFIINRKMKYYYSHITKDLNCKISYKKPVYPFVFNSRNCTDNGQTQILNWFDYISLALELNRKYVAAIPLTLTMFSLSGNEKKIAYTNVKPGLKVLDIAEQFNISGDSSIILNHPFKSNIFSFETKLNKIQPMTFIVYPRGLMHRPPITNYFPVIFRKNANVYTEYKIVIDTYKDNPCQKCLRCSSICPAELYPFMLSAIAEQGNLKDAVQLNLDKCIECGLCSYACPSDIPLMHNIVKLKKEL